MGSRTGQHHTLTEAGQGKFQYVYGPYAEPVLRIEQGDTLEVETIDALAERGGPSIGGADSPHIRSILPRGPKPAGTTALIPEFGGLVGTSQTAMLNAPLPERVKKMEVTPAGARFSNRITMLNGPFIGTLGVSPQIEAVSLLQPDYWGGKIDLPDAESRSRWRRRSI